MKSMTRALVGILIAFAAAACSVSTPTTSTETVCDARAQVEESVEAFDALDPATASVDGYREAAVQIRESIRELAFYRQDMAEENLADLEESIEALVSAMDSLPSDEPLTDAIGSVEPEREAVRAAFSAITDELSCP